MSVDDISYKIPNVPNYNCRSSCVFFIIRSQNDLIDEPGNVPADEEEVADMHTDM